MSFQILKNKGVFELYGNFTSTNTVLAKEYFDSVLDNSFEIKMCLKGVERIDLTAVHVLKVIKSKANIKNKKFLIEGSFNMNIENLIE